MNYRSIAQSILQTLPTHQDSSPLQPITKPVATARKQSDDEHIAQKVWVRLQLEISFNRSSPR